MPESATAATLQPLKNWSHPFKDRSNPLLQLTQLAKATAGYYPLGRNGFKVLALLPRGAQFALLLTLSPFFCQAQSSLLNTCLNDRMDSQDIYECSKYKSAEADSTLNNVYKILNEKITTDYKSSPLLGNTLKAHIKNHKEPGSI